MDPKTTKVNAPHTWHYCLQLGLRGQKYEAWMPDVRFFPFVDGITRSQSAVAPNKHHTVGSMGGTVRWDTYVPSGVKGLNPPHRVRAPPHIGGVPPHLQVG